MGHCGQHVSVRFSRMWESPRCGSMTHGLHALQGIKVKDSATKKKAIALIEARKAAISAAMEED